MSELVEEFIVHLLKLRRNDPGALTKLRASLDAPLGNYAAAFPYVEPLLASRTEVSGSTRLALYLSAGLFGLHPTMSNRSLPANCGVAMSRSEGSTMERRLLSLLEAQPEQLSQHLRRLVAMLAGEGLGLDYMALLSDLCIWLEPSATEERKKVHFRWLQEFYSAASTQYEYVGSSLKGMEGKRSYESVY